MRLFTIVTAALWDLLNVVIASSPPTDVRLDWQILIQQQVWLHTLPQSWTVTQQVERLIICLWCFHHQTMWCHPVTDVSDIRRGRRTRVVCANVVTTARKTLHIYISIRIYAHFIVLNITICQILLSIDKWYDKSKISRQWYDMIIL